MKYDKEAYKAQIAWKHVLSRQSRAKKLSEGAHHLRRAFYVLKAYQISELTIDKLKEISEAMEADAVMISREAERMEEDYYNFHEGK